MNIPDAAIEAAADAILETKLGLFLSEREDIARAAIEAAMPAIREALAQEIEERLLVRVEHLSVGRVDGLEEAVRIVRGGTP